MEENLPGKKSQLKSLDIKNLITKIQTSEEPKELQMAQFEFYHRFAPHIYSKSFKNCLKFRDGEEMAKDILSITFSKALEAINRFKYPEGISDIKKIENHVKAWLGKIANRVFLTEISKRTSNSIDIDSIDIVGDVDSWILSDGSDSIDIPNEYKIYLDNIMSTLSDQDKHIILTYASEGCIDSTKHLSQNAMNLLCETYNTTPEAIRQRKKRTLDKIKPKQLPNQ